MIERWQRKTMQSLRYSLHHLQCTCQGVDYTILASACSLLLNFLKYSLLCSSFGTKLSSCESSHHGALNLERRQRSSSLERGGLRCGLSSWHYCKKCSVLALHHFSFLLVSWEHSSCCFFLPLTHSLVVIQNETTSFYLGTKEILLQCFL